MEIISTRVDYANSLPTCKITINGKEVNIILDTASGISIIDMSLIGPNCNVMDVTTRVRGVANNLMTLDQVAIVKFSLKDRTFHDPFRVSNSFGPLARNSPYQIHHTTTSSISRHFTLT